MIAVPTPHPVRRALPVRLAGLALALLLVATSFGARPAGAQQGGPDDDGDVPVEEVAERPGRLLIYSLPGVSWADLRRQDLPVLESFLEGAALADLAPRGVFARSGPGDAYLTISGGSRATTVRDIDGQVLAVEEESAGSAAGDIYQRRTGVEPGGPFVSLTWPTLQRANDAEPFDTELGLLTETLVDAGVAPAVIGNADGVDSLGDSYERQVGLALADPTGAVLAGSLGKDLLTADPSQPFGLRLDETTVAQRFAATWASMDPSEGTGGGVVLVEASDLARTLRYRPIVDFERYSEMWEEALDHSDQLFEQLLASVDPARDTVLVVAPYNGRGDRDLTAVALRGPGVAPGYLRSASTQRTGFLTLVDIGPTILDQFGIDRPTAMEGRPAVVVASSLDAQARVDHLISLNDASRFREQLLTPTTTVAVLLMAAVLALAVAAHANRWGRRTRAAIAFAGLVDLTLLPASYLARIFDLEARGTGFYWTVLLVTAVAVPAVATLVAHRRGSVRAPLIVVLSLMALVLVGDVVTGSRLSLSAAFGYSATGNSRLYGISNYAYGQLATATCLVAAWLAAVRPGRSGKVLAIGAMLATLVVLGVPIWGSDVGGVLAFTPAVAVFAFAITGRRIRARTLVLGGLATVLAIVVFGVLDLARAPANRGHLGRLFERVGDEGPAPLVSIIERKLLANLEVSTSSLWVLAIPLAVAFWVFLRRFPDRPYERIVARFATLPAGLAAALVGGVLGSALNDSGAIIGGIAGTVITVSLAALLLEGDPPPPLEPLTSADDPVRVPDQVPG